MSSSSEKTARSSAQAPIMLVRKTRSSFPSRSVSKVGAARDMKRSVGVGRALISVLLLTAVIFTGACAAVPLGSGAIDSQIVDADTGVPVAGVVVVGYWELSKGSLTGDGLPCGSANVEEAVSGDDGRFRLPGWGPRYGHCMGDMHDGSPQMLLFKSGYGYATYRNGYGTGVVSWTSSTWDGQQMKMKAFDHPDVSMFSKGSYLDGFGQLNQDLMWFVVNMPTECNWKKIPNMLRAIAAERSRLSSMPSRPVSTVVGSLESHDSYLQKKAPGCGSPKEFIEGLMKQDVQSEKNTAAH